MTNYMVKKSEYKSSVSQRKLDFSQNNAYDLPTLFNLKGDYYLFIEQQPKLTPLFHCYVLRWYISINNVNFKLIYLSLRENSWATEKSSVLHRTERKA